MKAILISALLASSVAMAQEGKMTATGTPVEVCNKLVEAAKTDDFAAVASLSATPKMGKPHQGKFKKMHGDYLAKIKAISCGTEHVAGEHAFVEATGEGQKRFIPFVSMNGEWKFDMKTYKVFYGEGHGKKGMKKTM